MPSFGQSPARSASHSAPSELLSLIGGAGSQSKPITRQQVRRLIGAIPKSLDHRRRAPRQLATELQRVEQECRFTPSGRAEFQTLLGALGIDSAFAIQVPTNSQPYWSAYQHPLRHFRAHPELPATADVVIIGAGLTGASAAYHLRDAARAGCRVVVLERAFPASEASGRNAGNFELLPENSAGTYDGFVRERLHFLGRCYPDIPHEMLRVEAERQASLVLSFAVRNRERLKQIITEEKLACDFSPGGWLYLAHTEREEQAICDEVVLASRHDQRVDIWSRMKIRQEFGFERGFIGRFVPEDGTYHPGKFVYGVLQVAVNAGVELYTGVAVKAVRDTSDGCQVVETHESAIRAKAVIAATNAFTQQLFPELDAIRPAQSQISVTEFVADRCRGRAVTSEEGPVYFNQPRGSARDGMAPLLLGGGRDRPMRNPSSRRRSTRVHARLLELRNRFFPELRQRPFSTEWVGPIAFTPDQLPAMGFLRPGVIIAAGFNGYGGSYCVAAGEAAADMATSAAVPDWLPEDVFSPQRLLNDKALFFAEISNLWCYAASLCAELRTTHRQLAEALKYSSPSFRGRRSVITANVAGDAARPHGESLRVPLHTLRPFRRFSPEECAEIEAIAHSRTAAKGDVLLTEDGNAACFMVMRGAIKVYSGAETGNKALARLKAAGIFGHLPLIDGGPSSGIHRAEQETDLLEITHDACYRLLSLRSPLAYKFLTILTDEIIGSLRDAERQIKRLRDHHAPAARGR